MIAAKMIIAVFGSLIFLGVFSVTAPQQEISLKSCDSKTSVQINCLTTKNTQLNGKG